MDKKIGEVLTANDALRRVGCAELCDPRFDSVDVDWRGMPSAFSCGRTKVVDGRSVRVSQSLCSGNILFRWACVGNSNGHPFHLNSGFAVCVDKRDGDTFLVAVIMC